MEKTIKQVAEELGTTSGAIYQQRNRNKELLAPHFTKRGRRWYVDDVGQELLRARIQPAPSPVIENEMRQELEQLRAEKMELLIRISNLEHERAETASRIAQAEARALLLDDVRGDLQALREELNSFQSVAFGFYRKKK